jgi:hypothetical protein
VFFFDRALFQILFNEGFSIEKNLFKNDPETDKLSNRSESKADLFPLNFQLDSEFI